MLSRRQSWVRPISDSAPRASAQWGVCASARAGIWWWWFPCVFLTIFIGTSLRSNFSRVQHRGQINLFCCLHSCYPQPLGNSTLSRGSPARPPHASPPVVEDTITHRCGHQQSPFPSSSSSHFWMGILGSLSDKSHHGT